MDYTTDIDITATSVPAPAAETRVEKTPPAPRLLKPFIAEDAPKSKWEALKEKFHTAFMKAIDFETLSNARKRDFEAEEIELVHAFLKERGEDKIIRHSRDLA